MALELSCPSSSSPSRARISCCYRSTLSRAFWLKNCEQGRRDVFPCQRAAANELGDRCLRQWQPLCPWVGVCSLPGLEPGLPFQHMGTSRAFHQQRASSCNWEQLGAASTAQCHPWRRLRVLLRLRCSLACTTQGAIYQRVAPWSCHPSHGAISSGPGGALQLAAGAPAQRPACCCELTFGKAGNKPPSSAAGPSAPAFGCLSSSRRQTLLCCSCLLQICGLGPPKACQESRASGGSACQGRTGAEERPSRCCGRWRSPSACRALLPSHPLI